MARLASPEAATCPAAVVAYTLGTRNQVAAADTQSMDSHGHATRHVGACLKPTQAWRLVRHSRGDNPGSFWNRGTAAVLLFMVGNTHVGAALTDADLIARALAAARKANVGAKIEETFHKHCLERALAFSMPIPPVGRRENLNEVLVERRPIDRVAFVHYGTAYDGLDCRVVVDMDRAGRVRKVTSALVKRSGECDRRREPAPQPA